MIRLCPLFYTETLFSVFILKICGDEMRNFQLLLEIEHSLESEFLKVLDCAVMPKQNIWHHLNSGTLKRESDLYTGVQICRFKGCCSGFFRKSKCNNHKCYSWVTSAIVRWHTVGKVCGWCKTKHHWSLGTHCHSCPLPMSVEDSNRWEDTNGIDTWAVPLPAFSMLWNPQIGFFCRQLKLTPAQSLKIM